MIKQSLSALSILFLVILFYACDNSTSIINQKTPIHLIPYPKEISSPEQVLVLSEKSEIYSDDMELAEFLNLLSLEIKTITNTEVEVSNQENKYSDILFSIQSEFNPEEYSIQMGEIIEVKAGSYQALCMAKSTLLQLLFVQDGKLCFPKINIDDWPSSPYRGLMIDLARNWHSMETLKKIIDLAAFYKTNYLQLHFSDYQSYTLPSKKYPKLSTIGRHYSFAELEELEAYAHLRGVAIIPEIDIPGHSSAMVKAYPELFGLAAIEDNPWIINMGKEEVYEAIAEIFEEIIPIFKSSPYVHIGGDEAIFYKTEKDPDAIAYMTKHKLDDVHELYRHFIVRLNDIIKSQGKQMCLWEGFRRDGKISIPKDIIVFEFETNRYLPNHLVEDGYTVVNTSWKPLYVVNKKKWEPRTIYDWNLWRWENWFPKAPSFTPIQLEPSPLIIGAQMCAWEQAEEKEVPSLRKRLPALNERIWNTETNPTYSEFMIMLNSLDGKYSQISFDDRQDPMLLNHNYVDDRPDK